MNYKLAFLFVLFSAIICYPQQFTNWKNYTDMKEVKNVYAFSNGVWAATGGGAFSYSGNGSSFTTLNKAEGLKGIDLTTVAGDESGKVWFGSTNGIIDIFNPEENSFRVILDIFNSNHINKSINDLILSGDTIIVSSDFGVSLIDADDLLFFDTFFKFGDFPTNTKVNSTVKIDLIYVCSDEGVAIQKQNAVNLSAPESWNVYREENGLPSNKTLKAGKFLSDIIVSTDNGFAKLSDTTWVPFLPQFIGQIISDFIITGDSLLILAENKIYTCEALLRWNHPERGYIEPDEFIPLAEQTGLIKPLTAWVLEKAVNQCNEWKEIWPGFNMSVNLSVHNLHDVALLTQVRQMISQKNMPASCITLEITEGDIMIDPIRAKEILESLSMMGITISIDDFGTGYSSLSYIKQLPVEEIKIDKSFVMEMMQDENDAVIVKATIELAHNLGLKIVAEGVKDQETWDRLRSLNCDIAQGFFISKPITAEEFVNRELSHSWPQCASGSR